MIGCTNMATCHTANFPNSHLWIQLFTLICQNTILTIKKIMCRTYVVTITSVNNKTFVGNIIETCQIFNMMRTAAIVFRPSQWQRQSGRQIARGHPSKGWVIMVLLSWRDAVEWYAMHFHQSTLVSVLTWWIVSFPWPLLGTDAGYCTRASVLK